MAQSADKSRIKSNLWEIWQRISDFWQDLIVCVVLPTVVIGGLLGAIIVSLVCLIR